MDTEDPEAMLAEAGAKARKLLEELLRQQAEVNENPPKISPEQLTQGRNAMQQAIWSTENMLAALDGAAEIADEAKNQ